MIIEGIKEEKLFPYLYIPLCRDSKGEETTRVDRLEQGYIRLYKGVESRVICPYMVIELHSPAVRAVPS